MNQQQDKNNITITISILIILWMILGFIAFIWSLVCFGRSGTTSQHVIGLVIAVLFGPFYWIYKYVVPDYCR